MGTLSIVATPIGNLEDISIRALRTLFSVDVIACEDTRRTGGLLQELTKRYGHIVPPSPAPRLIRYDNYTELTVTPELLNILSTDKNVALVSDAGTPLLNDPGYILVREARKKAIPIVSVPGASALLTALVSSGLPTDKFTFLGYPPEKKGARITLFQSLLSAHRLIRSTYVFYVSPHKLQSFLSDCKEILGDIPLTFGRELTKMHEEYWQGRVSDAIVHFHDPKGEFVVLFALT